MVIHGTDASRNGVDLNKHNHMVNMNYSFSITIAMLI